MIVTNEVRFKDENSSFSEQTTPYSIKHQELPENMTLPKEQNKMPETSYLGIEISKCSDEDFQISVLRKLSGIQENREVIFLRIRIRSSTNPLTE